MSPPLQTAAICPHCGARIETTASGDLGCLPCWLRSGLESSCAGPEENETPDLLGSYRIERREDGTPWVLGQGAMGVTYRAQDVSLERSVALKVINTQLCRHVSAARERFMREARAAASLRHPNVANVYQFGIEEESGQCFYAMELIEGETLEELVQRAGPLPVARVLQIARQIVGALIVAEKQGIVHRDLKPGNVMIEAADPAEGSTVKIIDFGLAKALGAAADAPFLTGGSFLGTPAFASPEQLQRVPVGVRSDIYSLGVTLWYLLTGQLPPAGRDSPPSTRQLKAARVPPSLSSLLVSMLATEPAARPSAREVATRLATKSPLARRAAVLATAVFCLGSLAVGFYFYSKRPGAEPAFAASPKSIAVLPFQILSRGEASASLAAGVHDTLLADLAQIADLKVISRTSVMQYGGGESRNLREIAQQLGVAYIVEGTIRVSGEKMRLNAQLIDARTDTHRWAQIYDRTLNDLFAVESEIAQTIAEQLDARIAPREKLAITAPLTRDLEAFRLYTQANLLLSETLFGTRGKANLLQATQLLGDAVGRDPHFLEAWCRLAAAHDTLYFVGFDRSPLRLSLAEAAVNAAVKVEPDAGLTHLARARHLYQGYLAYEPALTELAMARQRLTNSPAVFTLAVYIYRRQGRWEESSQAFENALALDPRNIDILKQHKTSYNLQRRYADAAAVLDRALLIAPNDFELRITRGEIEFDWKADPRPLHAVIASILAKAPSSAPDLAGSWMFLSFCERDGTAADRAIAALGDSSYGNDAIQLRPVFWKGLAAKMRQDRNAAKNAFAVARTEQERKVAAAPDFAPGLAILGLMDAALGRKEEAIEECRRAIEMLPVSRDPILGAQLLELRAIVYAWTGEPTLACDQIEEALKIPGSLSYGQLKLSPMWDELRGDERFERITASLAPER